MIVLKHTGSGNRIKALLPVPDKDRHPRMGERGATTGPCLGPAPGIREYELAPHCWLQLSEGATVRSEHCLLLGVTDIERERERLTRLGIEVDKIQRVEGAVAFAEFKDPDGNNLSLYQLEQSWSTAAKPVDSDLLVASRLVAASARRRSYRYPPSHAHGIVTTASAIGYQAGPTPHFAIISDACRSWWHASKKSAWMSH